MSATGAPLGDPGADLGAWMAWLSPVAIQGIAWPQPQCVARPAGTAQRAHARVAAAAALLPPLGGSDGAVPPSARAPACSYACWDPEAQVRVRVVCARPYHALFAHNMLIR